MKKKHEFLKALEDYYYDLPQELIASYPHPQRDASRLLVLQPGKMPEIQDQKFYELVNFLKSEDLLIVNNTRVSSRRIRLERKSGALLPVLFLEDLSDKKWSCLLPSKRKLHEGERLFLSENQNASSKKIEFIFFGTPNKDKRSRLLPVLAGSQKAAWNNTEEAELFFSQYGEIPLPPYLKREVDEADKEFYQTIYAKKSGSAAAPTAGLHFSEDLLLAVQTKGVQIEGLELEIGYSTFTPLEKENFSLNKLHKENYSIPLQLAETLNAKKKGRVIAVGTTTLRALEANFQSHSGKFTSGRFSTDLFLKPPDRIHSIDGLITNFHLPGSSLLLLVSAYTGNPKIVLKAYQHAVQKRYRFFSYGDAMLILKARENLLE